MIKKEWWPPLQSSWGPCAAETAPLLQLSLFGSWEKFQESILLTAGTNATLTGKYLLGLRETAVEERTFCPVKAGSSARSCDYRYTPRPNANAVDDYARGQGQVFTMETFVWEKLYTKISNNKQMKAHVLNGKFLLAAQKKKFFFL